MLGIALIAVVGVFIFALVTVGILFHTKAVAQTASDQAATAGANAVLHESAGQGEACSAASRAAVANGASLEACQLIGRDIRTAVSKQTGIAFVPEVSVSSRAGPVGCQ